MGWRDCLKHEISGHHLARLLFDSMIVLAFAKIWTSPSNMLSRQGTASKPQIVTVHLFKQPISLPKNFTREILWTCASRHSTSLYVSALSTWLIHRNQVLSGVALQYWGQEALHGAGHISALRQDATKRDLTKVLNDWWLLHLVLNTNCICPEGFYTEAKWMSMLRHL